ncbi:MAG: DUF4249 family protein [Crocinitomicaceae bacterium]
MTKILKITLAIVLSFGFFACEEVIELPLNNANQKIVVEAFTSNIEGRSYVKLTKTSNVYTTNNFETVSGANVLITDSDGNNFLFKEDSVEKGLYIYPGYKVEPNKTYDIKIVADGQEITGTSTSSNTPSISFLAAGPKGALPEELQDGLGFFPDTTRLVFYLFPDPAPIGDNYRIIAYVNGEKDNTLYYGNDVLGSGIEVGGVLFGTSVDSGDVVHMELMTIDKTNYDYYFSLDNNTDTGPFAATPSNPVSNLSDNALGYFGAYLMDTVSTIAF